MQVTHRDPEDYTAARQEIYDKVFNSMQRAFPKSYAGVTMELEELQWSGDETASKKDIKAAVLNAGSLDRRLRGTLVLKEDKTGAELDRKTLTLAKVPILTDLGTFMDNGSGYTIAMQSRLLPGAYTRRKSNGNLETQFNVKVGTGAAFRVSMDPRTSVYHLEKSGSKVRLYPVLQGLGVSDDELKEAWGEGILNANRAANDPRSFEKAVKAFVKQKAGVTDAPDFDSKKALMDALEEMKISKGVISTTLPNYFSGVKTASADKPDKGDRWVAAMQSFALKLASTAGDGSIVLFWLGGGEWLLQENTEGRSKGKLRPAGGSSEPEDKGSKKRTILREIEEEFGISPDKVLPSLRYKGHIKKGRHAGTAVYIMWNHGLQPGVYQASNDPNEKIKLVKARLDHPDYIGPNLTTDLTQFKKASFDEDDEMEDFE
jgi:8-oxo-dGTP pyrophosphatase MutT (NUDIX family)